MVVAVVVISGGGLRHTKFDSLPAESTGGPSLMGGGRGGRRVVVVRGGRIPPHARLRRRVGGR